MAGEKEGEKERREGRASEEAGIKENARIRPRGSAAIGQWDWDSDHETWRDNFRARGCCFNYASHMSHYVSSL